MADSESETPTSYSRSVVTAAQSRLTSEIFACDPQTVDLQQRIALRWLVQMHSGNMLLYSNKTTVLSVVGLHLYSIQSCVEKSKNQLHANDRVREIDNDKKSIQFSVISCQWHATLRTLLINDLRAIFTSLITPTERFETPLRLL